GRTQSVRARVVTRNHMRDAFRDLIIDPELLDRLGPALNSGKAIFVYGVPGTGKTYVAQRLSRLMDDAVLVPHAIAVSGAIIEVFDPAAHRPYGNVASSMLLDEGHDPRFALCRRPAVIAAGELSAEMLEVQFDPVTRRYRAPLQ